MTEARPRLRDDAHAVYRAAVAGARADALLERLVARIGLDALAPRRVADYARIVVVGAGKGALAMAGAAERVLREVAPPIVGQVVVPHGYGARRPADLPAPARVVVREGGHPSADADSAAAARTALELARGCGPDDLLLVLLSGGASALWGATAPGVPLDDARAVVGMLQRAGADIAALNAVRKHLALLGGGRLAAAAGGADVATLVLSDVIGDEPSVIGSGPTSPDPTTHADAIRTLRAHAAWSAAPESVRAHLRRGAADATQETPKPGDPVFARTRLHLLGGVADALAAARAAAGALGYDVRVRGGALAGEARDAGRLVARAALGATRGGAPTCVLWGGETTVTVRGRGTGGRNQELALAAALTLDEGASIGALPPDADVVVLSGGTDGIDGPTDAAGAWATPHTVRDARARGLDARRALDDNDAYGFFAGAHGDVGGLLRPGPTHTNVMDVQVALVRPGAP